MLANVTELGNTPKLEHLYLDWTYSINRFDTNIESEFRKLEGLRFYHAIQEHSKKMSPEEFRLHLVANLEGFPKVNPSTLLDLQPLTDLTMKIRWGKSAKKINPRRECAGGYAHQDTQSRKCDFKGGEWHVQT